MRAGRLDAIYALNIAGAWAIVRRLCTDVKELVALSPDAILAGVGATAEALQQATRVVPIVFAQGIDAVGNGYVDSLSRPGGNTTGFVQLNYGLAGKWLELLKEVAPQVTRVAMLRGTWCCRDWPVGRDAGSSPFEERRGKTN